MDCRTTASPNPTSTTTRTSRHRAREIEGGDDGTYVGRTGSDDALDAGETGAEARGEAER